MQIGSPGDRGRLRKLDRSRRGELPANWGSASSKREFWVVGGSQTICDGRMGAGGIWLARVHRNDGGKIRDGQISFPCRTPDPRVVTKQKSARHSRSLSRLSWGFHPAP